MNNDFILFRQKINEALDHLAKCLDVSTVQEDKSIPKILYECLNVAKKSESFDHTFIESLHKNFAKYGKLSPKQEESLMKIAKTLKVL